MQQWAECYTTVPKNPSVLPVQLMVFPSVHCSLSTKTMLLLVLYVKG